MKLHLQTPFKITHTKGTKEFAFSPFPPTLNTGLIWWPCSISQVPVYCNYYNAEWSSAFPHGPVQHTGDWALLDAWFAAWPVTQTKPQAQIKQDGDPEKTKFSSIIIAMCNSRLLKDKKNPFFVPFPEKCFKYDGKRNCTST